MYKDLIKKHLGARISEAKVPGLATTEKAQKESKAENQEYYDDTAKKFAEVEKDSAQEDTNAVEPVKRNYSDSEKEFHDDYETLNGMEMLRYDGSVDEKFKERQEMAIKGDPKMGNDIKTGKWNPETGEGNGNTEPVWGASDVEFGKKLIDRIKRSAKKREDATQSLHQFGDDIEVAAGDPKITKRNIAVESTKKRTSIKENYDFESAKKEAQKISNDEGVVQHVNKISDDKYEISDWYDSDTTVISFENGRVLENKNNENNKPKITENKMKRLKFKKPFGGRNNALKLIPEHYKMNNKVFEMTDGNETYKVRWEGNKPVILESKNQTKINDDVARMKQLFNYNSRDTFGTLKGAERIEENKNFKGIMDKSKGLIVEDEDGNRMIREAKEVPETAKETEPGEEITKQAPEAKKHMKDGKGKDLSQDKAKEIDPASGLKEGEIGENDEVVTETEEVPTSSPEALPAKEKVSSKGPDKSVPQKEFIKTAGTEKKK